VCSRVFAYPGKWQGRETHPPSLSLSLSFSSALLHTRDRILTALNYLPQLQPLVPAVGTEVLSQACVCVIRYHLVGGVRVPNRPVTRLSRFPGIPGERKAIKRSWTKRKERESPGKKSKRPANELVAKRVPVCLQGFQIRPLFFATSVPADASIRQSPPRMRCTAKFSAYTADILSPGLQRRPRARARLFRRICVCRP